MFPCHNCDCDCGEIPKSRRVEFSGYDEPVARCPIYDSTPDERWLVDEANRKIGSGLGLGDDASADEIIVFKIVQGYGKES